jgi:hypothetical protein
MGKTYLDCPIQICYAYRAKVFLVGCGYGNKNRLNVHLSTQNVIDTGLHNGLKISVSCNYF